MKPNFALNLSHDGIELFHRGKAGWRSVGSVALDDAEIGERLGMLRKTAVELESGGLATKVIIPDSQILYTEIAAPAGDERTGRAAQIRRALEGLTPYDVDDLVFDWRAEGDRVKLAVLARDTIAEAEEFAREHRFNPVSFVAAPGNGQFEGEPFFGEATSASEMLATLGAVERDPEAIDLEAARTGRRSEPRAAAEAEPATVEEAEAEAAGAEPEPAPPPEPQPQVLAGSIPDPDGETGAPAKVAAPAEKAEAASGEISPTFASRRDGGRLESAVKAAREAAPRRPEPPVAPAPAAPKPGTAAVPPRPTPRLVASAPATPRDAVAAPRAVPDAASTPPLAAPAAAAAANVRPFPPPAVGRPRGVDFGNRRGEATALKIAPEPDLPPPQLAMPPQSFARPRAGRARRSPAMVVILTVGLLAVLIGLALWVTFTSGSPTDEDLALAGQRAQDSAADIAPSDILPPAADAAAEDVPDSTPAPTELSPAAEEAALPQMPDDPAAATLAARAPLVPRDPENAIPDTAEDAALAAPGDGAGTSDLGDASQASDAAAPGVEELAAADDIAADEAAAPAADEVVPSVEDEALADGEPEAAVEAAPGEADLALEPGDIPALPQDPVTELVATDDGAAARVQEQLARELTPEVATRIYDGTGLWVLPPAPPAEPAQDRTDDIYVAAIDTETPGVDAVALPEAVAPDPAVKPLVSPPAAGTVFDLDADGRVRATPEGAVTPDGVKVFLGRPTPDPRPRPGTETSGGATAQNPAAPAQPALPKVRPRPRPADLTQSAEKAQLGGRTREQLARLQPRHRPATILALAEAMATPPSGDGTADPAAAASAAAALLGAGSRFAIDASIQPRRRPAEIVAVAAATRITPPPATSTARAAPPPEASDDAAAAEADGEPQIEEVSVAPSLPSRAGVAKTATERNVLNLSKVNLIGVYGSPSNRRALVRMSNGRYVKVEVGDRLDGGRVSSISDASLTYTKGGRQVKLALPKT